MIIEAERGNQTLAEMVAAHPGLTSELTLQWDDIEWVRAERRSHQFAVELHRFLIGQ